MAAEEAGGSLTLTPIGIIHTPYTEPQGTPVQPAGGKDIEGRIEVFPAYAEGLTDLDGFSHIIVLFHFDRAAEGPLQCMPYMDDTVRGVFATRSPRRPNPIGFSVVRLDRIEENVLHIRDLDILDGTPLLDIKPWVPPFDDPGEVRLGWLTERAARVEEARDDGRFSRE